jgi:hypothetical protein
MSTDDKSPAPNTFPHRGIRIFTYPKIIFIWPTFVAAVICAIIMAASGNDTTDPHRGRAGVEAATTKTVVKAPAADAKAAETDARTRVKTTETETTAPAKVKRRFSTPQNIAGMLFLTIFFLNLLVMSVDFPRFTIIALILGGAALSFLILYLNVYFELLPGVILVLESVYAVANTWFYAMIATLILINFLIVWGTRYLDYWVIMPNEILHNHGPFSDLERFPTFNLKFDKEIPDILEYMLLGSGRLILHIANERRAIVLDNVLWIDAKENELKKVMSRLDVRVTTDQETVEPA